MIPSADSYHVRWNTPEVLEPQESIVLSPSTQYTWHMQDYYAPDDSEMHHTPLRPGTLPVATPCPPKPRPVRKLHRLQDISEAQPPEVPMETYTPRAVGDSNAAARVPSTYVSLHDYM